MLWEVSSRWMEAHWGMWKVVTNPQEDSHKFLTHQLIRKEIQCPNQLIMVAININHQTSDQTNIIDWPTSHRVPPLWKSHWSLNNYKISFNPMLSYLHKTYRSISNQEKWINQWIISGKEVDSLSNKQWHLSINHKKSKELSSWPN